MIKIMIVDDEILTRIGIASMYKWSENGYVIVGEADNGISALEIAEREKPDIILTDIKMPAMNGIEFMKEAQKRGLKSKFVILSAYSEFEYVREGMKLGAEDYILKLELEPDKLVELLNRISEKIRLERDASPSSRHSKKVYRISKRHIKAKCIYDILTGKYGTADDIGAALKSAGLSIKPENLVCIAVQSFNQARKHQAPGKADLHSPPRIAVLKVLNELIGNYGTGCGCMIDNHLYSFMASLDSSSASALGSSHYSRIKADIIEHVKNTFNISLAVHISGPTDDYAKLPLLFRQLCRHTENGYVIIGENTGARHAAQENSFNFPFGEELSRIDAVLKSTNIDELDASFACLVNKIKSHGDIPSKVLHGICQTLIHITDTFIGKNSYLEHDWNRSEELLFLIKSCKTQDQYTSYIQSLGRRLSRYIKSDKDFKTVILKAKQYIQQNYHKDISLESTALHINLSPTYFSRLFSRETGVSFIDYLTALRVERAKEYLKNTNKRVHEISELTGYKNPYYFSRIFKKVTGVTPLEYRS